MIRANTDRKWLPLYEALASEVRLRILELLAEKPMNLKEIAERLELSSAILTMHIRKLELSGLIDTKMVRKHGGTHKICSLAETSVEIALPHAGTEERLFYEQNIPVGHYTSFDVHPTCGLATREKLIGQFDDPRYFLDPERVNAAIIWFGKGFVEYKTPNYLLPSQQPEELEISFEIASEAPGSNDQWPSDIRFYINDVRLGEWTSPGDYGGDSRGRFTPDWWAIPLNQFGLWKALRVNNTGTYMDGQKISDTKLDDLRLEKHFWTIRFTVEEDAQHVGGLTLYGSGFGNYNQDIQFRMYYSQRR
ncbi:ArsR/SmtB family transcription factor [Cohnella silvisoli]|uniref:Helix-turn-helix domain-containing protein n=1 Tax=Cohnella silvisoli TaxID=2873699 RepID=A0ABV1KUC6_9BACL|nr:helix-turn-helix domain-containing protein [Cohnella silvisoli]MCD9021425.1 helix-turn-helix domain-containing protein [Cohnella silvisoli]